jgi:hypothetical protein
LNCSKVLLKIIFFRWGPPGVWPAPPRRVDSPPFPPRMISGAPRDLGYEGAAKFHMNWASSGSYRTVWTNFP